MKRIPISLVVIILAPLVLFAPVFIIERTPNWQIALIPYSIYVVLVSFFAWFFKSEKRKNILFFIIGLIVLTVCILIAVNNIRQIRNSYFATGTIEYIDPKAAGKSDTHRLSISFINKDGNKVSFEGYRGYASELSIGDYLEVIYDKEGGGNPRIYDSGDVWLPFIITLFVSASAITGSIASGRKTNRKHIVYKKKS